MTNDHSHQLFDEETYKFYAPNRKLTDQEENKVSFESIFKEIIKLINNFVLLTGISNDKSWRRCKIYNSTFA